MDSVLYAPAAYVTVSGPFSGLHVLCVQVSQSVYDDYLLARDVVITVSRMITDGATFATIDDYVKSALSDRDTPLRELLTGFGLHLGSGRIYGSKAALNHAMAFGLEGRVPMAHLKHYPHARVFCTRL
jgi:hypothetical protein